MPQVGLTFPDREERTGPLMGSKLEILPRHIPCVVEFMPCESNQSFSAAEPPGVLCLHPYPGLLHLPVLLLLKALEIKSPFSSSGFWTPSLEKRSTPLEETPGLLWTERAKSVAEDSPFFPSKAVSLWEQLNQKTNELFNCLVTKLGVHKCAEHIRSLMCSLSDQLHP